MNEITHPRRLKNFKSTARYSEPELTSQVNNKAAAEKPARITRRQLAPAIALLRRVAAGGDATTAVDAAALLPVLERASAAAPPGQPRARCCYVVTLVDGTVHQAHGIAAAARLVGKVHGTVANALSKGGGKAKFPGTDNDGNPGTVLVEKLA